MEKKIEEKEKQNQKKEKEFQMIIVDNKKEYEKKMEENKKELVEKIEEKERQNQERERQNKEIFKKLLEEMKGYFSLIEFAIYCRQRETANYDAFRRTLA